MNVEKLYNIIVQNGGDKLSLAWTIKQVCINILASMFTYDGLPESIPEEFVEQFLIMNGSIPGWRYDGPDADYTGKLIVSIGGQADAPNVYGIGKNYIAVTQNGYTKRLTPGEDSIIIYNNSLKTSDMDIINAFADMLTEEFVSLKANVLYSRNKPVFKASTDKERAAIVESFKKIKNDLEPIVITSENILEQLDGAPESVKVLDITDVNNADKIQYIVKAIDDTFRWFFTLYGQSVQGNGKMAQQTVKEVDGSTSLSFIYPNDRLKQRQKGFDAFNKMFGTDITVRFSDAWLTESIKYKNEADIDNDQLLEDPAAAPEEQPDGQPEEVPERQPDEQPEEREEREENE